PRVLSQVLGAPAGGAFRRGGAAKGLTPLSARMQSVLKGCCLVRGPSGRWWRARKVGPRARASAGGDRAMGWRHWDAPRAPNAWPQRAGWEWVACAQAYLPAKSLLPCVAKYRGPWRRPRVPG